MKIKNHQPIGIFDSGVGGLTVYRALHEKLQDEHFIYLGDTARVPYGTKSLATVERYAIENSQFLASRGIKLLVVACNTASALALPKIREKIGLDVVGVIGPGARKAVSITQDKFENPKIGVIATEATVSSNAYADSIERAAEKSGKTEIIQTACPLFVPLAEENWTNEPEISLPCHTYSDLFSSCREYSYFLSKKGKLYGPPCALRYSTRSLYLFNGK